jgi:hypothetical protein
MTSTSKHSTSNLTEDDTFRKLKRGTFEEAQQAWDGVLRSGFSVQKSIEKLKEVGWTKDEYYSEYSRRTGWKD